MAVPPRHGCARHLLRVGMALLFLPGCHGAKLALVEKSAELKHPRVPTVSVEEAEALAEQGAVWVDVRTDAERSVSRIPGAIEAEDVEQNPDAYRGRVLVAYCTVGVRSADWAAERREDGLDARNLRGSVMAWARAGRAFETPDGEPTRRVHTWSGAFDWLPKGYEGTQEPPLPQQP